MNFTITGHHAIRIAERDGVALNKYADPIEPEDHDISAAEAEVIAADDASLIYCTVVPHGPMPEGFHVTNYFHIHTGRYLGPDEDGVEPRWQDAGGAL